MTTVQTTIFERPLNYANLGASTSALVYSGPVVVIGITGWNESAGVLYLQLFDKATAPVATNIPTAAVRINSTSVFGSTMLPVTGVLFPNGLGFAWSTTRETFTDAAAAGTQSLTLVYAPV